MTVLQPLYQKLLKRPHWLKSAPRAQPEGIVSEQVRRCVCTKVLVAAVFMKAANRKQPSVHQWRNCYLNYVAAIKQAGAELYIKLEKCV